MTAIKGLVHKYLGVTINYSIVGNVEFTIFDYLEDVIVACVEELEKSCSIYPRNNQLSKVDEDSPRL